MIRLHPRGLSCLTLSFCCLDRVINLDQYELFFEVDDSNGASVSFLVDFLCRLRFFINKIRHCFLSLGFVCVRHPCMRACCVILSKRALSPLQVLRVERLFGCQTPYGGAFSDNAICKSPQEATFPSLKIIYYQG